MLPSLDMDNIFAGFHAEVNADPCPYMPCIQPFPGPFFIKGFDLNMIPFCLDIQTQDIALNGLHAPGHGRLDEAA
ncbi:MAG: hypothetical protein Q9M30_00635 [Mariprofundaceae bacterium]|nr:hypothetical protein [Mariprofundaceae bacterium]